jgi:hypothetical protein
VLDRVRLVKASNKRPESLLDRLLKIYTKQYNKSTNTFKVSKTGDRELACLNEAVRYVEEKTRTNTLKTGPNTPCLGALAYENDRDRRKYAMVSLDMSNIGALKTVLSNYITYNHLTNFSDPGAVYQKDRFHGTKANTFNTQRKIIYDLKTFHTVFKSKGRNIFTCSLSKKEQVSRTADYKIKTIWKMIVNQRLIHVTDGGLSKSKSDAGGYSELTSKFMGDFMQVCNCLLKNVYFASGDKMACVGYIVAWEFMRKSREVKLFVERSQSQMESHRIDLLSGMPIGMKQLPMHLKHFHSITTNKKNTPKNSPCMLQCLQQCKRSNRRQNQIPIKKRKLV